MYFQPTDKTVPELILGSKVSIYKKSVMPRTGYIGPELNLVISTMSNVLSRQAWFSCYDVLRANHFSLNFVKGKTDRGGWVLLAEQRPGNRWQVVQLILNFSFTIFPTDS